MSTTGDRARFELRRLGPAWAVLVLVWTCGLAASASAQEAAAASDTEPDVGAFGLLPLAEQEDPVVFELVGERKELTMESRGLRQALVDAGMESWGDVARANPESLARHFEDLRVVFVTTRKWGKHLSGGRSEPVSMGRAHSRLPLHLAKLLVMVAREERHGTTLETAELRRALEPNRVARMRAEK